MEPRKKIDCFASEPLPPTSPSDEQWQPIDLEDLEKRTKERIEQLKMLRERYASTIVANNDQNSAAATTDQTPNCFHLSDSQLETYFEKFLPFLQAIRAGETDSVRHRRFMGEPLSRTNTKTDLRYSETMLMFSECQLTFCYQLMRRTFGTDTNIFERVAIDTTNYFCQVLIPEFLCKVYFAECGRVTDC